MRRLIAVFLLLGCIIVEMPVLAQDSFCMAVEKGNFRKVYRQFNKQVKSRKWGYSYFNGSGSGFQVSHTFDMDTLTYWLKDKKCIADATWDKCEQHITIYPGWSVIGAKFETSKGLKEKCFYFQVGTTGNIKLLGWQAPIFKEKNKLILKRICDCNGFIEQQRINCQLNP